MITRWQYEEAKEQGDNKLIQAYADQLIEYTQQALIQFRLCRFTDVKDHELENNIFFQKLANSTFWQTTLKEQHLRTNLSPSEALYGFAGWLTTRDTVVIASAQHDASIWAELVDIFIKENKLEQPRDSWEYNLIHPKGKCFGGIE